MARELAIATVIHPEFLFDGTYLRVDHEGLRPLDDFDQRLAVYLHLRNQNFVLFRLEHDNEYRAVAQLPQGRVLNGETVNSLIQRLHEHDTHRGFDAHLEVVSAQDAIEREKRRVQLDFVTDWADKLHFGLSRSHLPGVDITRPRQAPIR